MKKLNRKAFRTLLTIGKYARWAVGIALALFLTWRIYQVLFVQQAFTADTWLRFALS